MKNCDTPISSYELMNSVRGTRADSYAYFIKDIIPEDSPLMGYLMEAFKTGYAYGWQDALT